jgi:hypothetical protein
MSFCTMFAFVVFYGDVSLSYKPVDVSIYFCPERLWSLIECGRSGVVMDT